MKKLLSIALVVILCLAMAGCAKLVETKYETVDVRVVDAYHRPGYTQPMMVGKIVTIRHISAVYRITVEYDGVEYTIGGSETYRAFKNKIGDTVSATLEIRSYDDGTVRYDIVSLITNK